MSGCGDDWTMGVIGPKEEFVIGPLPLELPDFVVPPIRFAPESPEEPTIPSIRPTVPEPTPEVVPIPVP